MVRAMRLNLNGDARKLRAIFRSSGIDYRHSVLADYGREEGFSFYADNEALEPFPGTSKRLEAFRSQAATVSVAAVRDMLRMRGDFDLKTITHLIVVCCTGMYAPGLDIDLVRELGLRNTVERTAINFMGCQAAINALRIADAVCARSDEGKVLVVCTEFCSLHFQREPTEDNLIANALFGDGSAAVLVEANTSARLRLHLRDFRSELALAGINDMAWTVGDLGFQMRLSAYVPDLVGEGVGSLVDALLSRCALDVSRIRYFAVHPGGKRILDAVERKLALPAEATRHSRDVLRQYGNMSSSTVLFVLHRLIEGIDNRARGEHILGLAFGPGLTMESVLITIEDV